MSVTVTRVLIVVGSVLGGVTGAIVTLVKLVPERAKTIVGYQGEVIEDLREELVRLKNTHKEEVDRLERRVTSLEDRVQEMEDS